MNQITILPANIYNQLRTAYEALGKIVDLVETKPKTSAKSKTIKLSKRASQRYERIDRDIEQGKNIYHASSVSDLMRHLHSDE